MHIISGADSGGAKTHLLNICCENSRFQNVIGSINGGSLYDEAARSGIDTVLFNQKNRADLSVIRDISDYIDKNRIDLVNFHGARANFLYAFLKKSMAVPGVTTVHSDYRYDFSNNRLKQAVFTPLNAASLRKFDYYICVSRRISQLLDEKGFSGKKFVVQNGIDTEKSVIKSRNQIRKLYGIPENAFVYTMVARFHPVKNHKGFIKAAARFMSEQSSIWLLFVGDGDTKDEMEALAKGLKINDRTVFAGYQKNVLDYINAGDINVLTSFNETFPIVILEGALVKKAALCSDVGDIKDILNNKKGFIVNPESVDDIYDKMKKAYDCGETLGIMGNRLYENVINEYTIDKFNERYYNAYNAIISGEKSGKNTGL